VCEVALYKLEIVGLTALWNQTPAQGLDSPILQICPGGEMLARCKNILKPPDECLGVGVLPDEREGHLASMIYLEECDWEQ